MESFDESKVSPTVARLNPHLFGGVGGLQKSKPKHRAKRTASKADENEARGEGSLGCRPVVTLVSFRARLIDDHDNLIGGFKHLRDRIAESIGLDDSDTAIEWRYYQLKVDSRREEGTLVKIEV